MADQREITPDDLITQFRTQVTDPDPKYDGVRQGFYNIDRWRGGRELSPEEFAGRILVEFPTLNAQYKIRGVTPPAAAPAPAPVDVPPAGPAPAGTPTGQPPAPSDDLWNAARRGAIKGVASMLDWGGNVIGGVANEAASLPALFRPKIDPNAARTVAAAPAKAFAASERAKAETLPPPSGILATTAEAIPHAIGTVAPYLALPGGGGNLANAARMGLTEAVRSEDQGRDAMLKSGAQGALTGGVLFPVANKFLGPVTKALPIPDAAQRFLNVAAPTTLLEMGGGAPLPDALSQGIAFGILGAPGHEAPRRGAVPQGKLPADLSGPVQIGTGGAAPEQAPHEFAADILRREAGASKKPKPVTIDRIQTITGLPKREAGKVMQTLLRNGVIDSSRNVIPAAGAPATGAPPAAPAVPMPEPTAQEKAAVQSLFAEPKPPAPAAPPPQIVNQPAETDIPGGPNTGGPAAPMVSRPNAEAPKSSAQPVANEDQIAANNARIAELERQLAAARQPAAAPAPVAAEPAPAAVAAPEPAPQPTTPAPTTPVETAPTPVEAPKAEAAAAPEVAAPNAAAMDAAAEEAAAIARLREKFMGKSGQRGSFSWKQPGKASPYDISAQDFQDLVTVGKGFLNRTGRSFEAWRDGMMKTFGDWVEAHLMPIWQQVSAGGAGRPGGTLQPPESTPAAESALPPAPPPGWTWVEQPDGSLKPVPSGGPAPNWQNLVDPTKTVRTTQVASPDVKRQPQAGISESSFPRPPVMEMPPSMPIPGSGMRAGANIGPETSKLPSERNVPAMAARVAAQGGPPIYEQTQGQGLPHYGEPIIKSRKGEDAVVGYVPDIPNSVPIFETRGGKTREIMRGVVPPQQTGPGAEERAAALTAEPPRLPEGEVSRRIGEAQTAASDRAMADESAQRLESQLIQQRQAQLKAQRAGVKPGKGEPQMPPLPDLPNDLHPAQYTSALEKGLRWSGFQERNLAQRYQGQERPHFGSKAGAATPNAPREKIMRALPSGNTPDQVWVKPVKDGTIEVQWDSDTHEFSATKYYRDTGEPSTVTGVGADQLWSYLNSVRARELPVPESQKKSGQKVAGSATVHVAPTGEPPAIGEALAQGMSEGANAEQRAAEQQLATTAGKTGSARELLSVMENIEARAKAADNAPQIAANNERIAQLERKMNALSQPRLPDTERRSLQEKLKAALDVAGMRMSDLGDTGPFEPAEGGPEKNAEAFRTATPPQINRVIASAIDRIVKSGGSAEIGKPMEPLKDRKIRPGDTSVFTVDYVTPDKSIWQVNAKEGGKTNVLIQKVKNNRFEVLVDGKVQSAKTSMLAAKDEAIRLAERHAYTEAAKDTPFQIPGVGSYVRMNNSVDADGNEIVHYKFFPEKGSPREHSMPLDRWEHIQRSGTPVNPFPKPKGQVGRPSNAKPPQVTITGEPPEGVAPKSVEQTIASNAQRIAELERLLAQQPQQKPQ